jgi:tetratricopeptide (TPR) repeat protein
MVPGGRALAIASLVLTLVPRAAYGDRAPDAVRAEALFEEGRRLMAARDFVAACPKLAESEQLDPAPGTLLNLAVCYERAGKPASAWATFKSAELAARRAGEIDRADASAQKARELEARLSRITFTVPGAPRATGLEVRCDGQAVREPTWGIALPYDPGVHEIEALAPGRRAWASRVTLGANAESVTVVIPALEELPPHAAVPPPLADASAAHGGGGPQRAAGVVFGGAGVAGLGVGIYAGLHAKSIYDSALAACGGGTTCPSGGRGPALRDQASSWATDATVAFVAGGAVLAAGALFYFTAPGRAVTLAPAARGAGLSLVGRF